MPKRDFLYALVASVLIAIFLPPTLKNLGFYDKIPNPVLVIYVGFPILAIVGTIVAHFIGRMIPILWQFTKFALVGVLNTSIDFGILNYLITSTGVERGVGIIPLNAISFSVATINSFLWNKSWVFKSKKKATFLTFFAVTLVGLLINTGVVYLLNEYVLPAFVSSSAIRPNIAKVFATLFSLVWNFLGYKLIVFKR